MVEPARPTPPATITHRELRNDSAAVLARVAAGEELLVTNNGEPVAYLVPVSASVRHRLVAAGRLRPRLGPLKLRQLGPPQVSDVDPQLDLDDDRGN